MLSPCVQPRIIQESGCGGVGGGSVQEIDHVVAQENVGCHGAVGLDLAHEVLDGYRNVVTGQQLVSADPFGEAFFGICVRPVTIVLLARHRRCPSRPPEPPRPHTNEALVVTSTHTRERGGNTHIANGGDGIQSSEESVGSADNRRQARCVQPLCRDLVISAVAWVARDGRMKTIDQLLRRKLRKAARPIRGCRGDSKRRAAAWRKRGEGGRKCFFRNATSSAHLFGCGNGDDGIVCVCVCVWCTCRTGLGPRWRWGTNAVRAS